MPRSTGSARPASSRPRRDGYDGKGQWRIVARRTRPKRSIWADGGCIYEGFVKFEAEFSVILVRGADGEIRFWDSAAERPRRRHPRAHPPCPRRAIVAAQVPAARALASARRRRRCDYVGVLTLEFFATAQGPVFNEMAPRVHNSGHWTIEGAATSQFENHIRAICGLPLGDTADSAARGSQ